MEKELEQLLTDLFQNKITDTDELRDQLGQFLQPKYSSPRFSSYLVLRCINNQTGLLTFLESAVSKKDKLTKNIKKIIVMFFAKMTKLKADYIKNYVGTLLVSL